MNRKALFIIGLIILAIIFAVFYFYKKPAPTGGKFDDFAKCLASKNITMYGAEWCLHCQNEKKAFGDSFKYVPYVECPDEPQKCLNEGITGYPTWIFPDKRKLIGEQGLEKLSQESGCPLPLE
jgi:hypothetical protein